LTRKGSDDEPSFLHPIAPRKSPLHTPPNHHATTTTNDDASTATKTAIKVTAADTNNPVNTMTK